VTITRSWRLGALAFAAAIVFGACSSGGGSSASTSTGASQPPASVGASTTEPSAAGPLSGAIEIDGSSTVYPITVAVSEEFQKVNTNVNVTAKFAGTGGGFKRFCNGETDINDASRPIKKDDAAEGQACTAKGIEYVELQVAIDGLTVVVNPANTFATCLTKDELKKIYGSASPKDLKWSDVRAGFPAETVKRFMPGADSGTFDYFTETINGKVDDATQNATQSEDDNILVTGVEGDANAISFFGYAYYVENKDKLKALQIDGGTGCVGPSDATINDGTYTPLSRPLFIYPDIKKAKAKPELKAYVDYYLANPNKLSAEVGYVALPDDLLKKSTDAWAAAVGG
jgi:phosphate transport system substrate-binding protein